MTETHALTDAGRPAGPCAIVIFGASGDLTKRKLLPALYNLKANRLLPKELAVIGVARAPKSHAQFREEQSRDIRQFATTPLDEVGSDNGGVAVQDGTVWAAAGPRLFRLDATGNLVATVAEASPAQFDLCDDAALNIPACKLKLAGEVGLRPMPFFPQFADLKAKCVSNGRAFPCF